jgi:hypothetical protein
VEQIKDQPARPLPITAFGCSHFSFTHHASLKILGFSTVESLLSINHPALCILFFERVDRKAVVQLDRLKPKSVLNTSNTVKSHKILQEQVQRFRPISSLRRWQLLKSGLGMHPLPKQCAPAAFSLDSGKLSFYLSQCQSQSATASGEFFVRHPRILILCHILLPLPAVVKLSLF